MTKRQLPPEIRAENLAIRGTNFASRDGRHFDNTNVEAGINVEPTVANQMARKAARHFRQVGDIFAPGNPSHELRQGLGNLLILASRHENYQPDTSSTHDLLAAVYEGLGGAIYALKADVSVDDLETGMFAAARLVRDIDARALEGDRHADDKCKAHILSLQLRAAEYRGEIEARRLERQRQTVLTMKPAPKQTTFLG
jgi:hypothetical protein